MTKKKEKKKEQRKCVARERRCERQNGEMETRIQLIISEWKKGGEKIETTLWERGSVQRDDGATTRRVRYIYNMTVT